MNRPVSTMSAAMTCYWVPGLLGVVLVLTGCTNEGTPDTPDATTTMTSTLAYEPFGEPCAGVPEAYAQSVDTPVGTAIGAEPLLSNLDVVLQQAGLVATLDEATTLTVLAPIDPAFQVLPRDTYQLNLTEPRLQLLLNHHLIDGRLTPDQLAPGQTTRNGDRIAFFPDGDTVTVPADNTLLRQVPATICGTLETANATVYLIDQVLLPRS